MRGSTELLQTVDPHRIQKAPKYYLVYSSKCIPFKVPFFKVSPKTGFRPRYCGAFLSLERESDANQSVERLQKSDHSVKTALVEIALSYAFEPPADLHLLHYDTNSYYRPRSTREIITVDLLLSFVRNFQNLKVYSKENFWITEI